MPYLEEVLKLQSKINELCPPEVVGAIAENARLFGKIPANILNAQSLAISGENLRKLQECANLAAKIFLRDMSPFLNASRAASMADTVQSLSRLRAEVIELEKRFPAPEKILDGLFDLETGAPQDAIAIPDGSPASVALAETAAVLRGSVDEIKKRLDNAPTEEEIPAGDETTRIKWEFVISLAIMLALAAPDSFELRAGMLRNLSILAGILLTTRALSGRENSKILQLIKLIIDFASLFRPY